MRAALTLAFILLAAPLSAAAAPNLSGDWSYFAGSGKMHLTQTGAKVQMSLTWIPNSEPAPHYIVNARLSGLALTGTWQCLVNACRHARGNFHAAIDSSGKQIVVSQTQDPAGSNGWNKIVFTRSASSGAASTAGSGKPCYVNSGAFASVAPCFGPVGTTIAVNVLRDMPTPPGQLRFNRVLASGAPGAVLETLQGSGTTYTTTASPALCAGPGFPKKWSVWLIDTNGTLRGEIGEFTATGCQ